MKGIFDTIDLMGGSMLFGIIPNKLYAIPDIAKKLNIKEKDVEMLLTLKIIEGENSFGHIFIRGSEALTIKNKLKKFKEELKKGNLLHG